MSLKMPTGRGRIYLLAILGVVIFLGYIFLTQPFSIYKPLNTSTNAIVSEVWFDTMIEYDVAPTDLDKNVGVDWGTVPEIVVFPSDPNYITFTFNHMTKAPYGTTVRDKLDWVRMWMSPIVQSFETGYLTQQYEWGAAQVDTSTIIFYKYQAVVPNQAGLYYFNWQGSTVEGGSAYAGAQKWYFELTGSNFANPLTKSTWTEIEKSSSKVVDFEGGIPIGAEVGVIPLQGETTTEENGDGIIPDVGEVPSFEWPILLIALIVGVRYVKKKHSED